MIKPKIKPKRTKHDGGIAPPASKYRRNVGDSRFGFPSGCRRLMILLRRCQGANQRRTQLIG